ncbi:cell envelope integrity protein CreD [Oligoflexus tunisiensis]|uniref:cell envelope integrity protein CreD n=1 Tax=Oligoflexus tunisiensis TaxID=708132 RepID=UPI000B1FB90C|nr:cell envelope integrity protein CreD [Oligoflexus tunisiensis]
MSLKGILKLVIIGFLGLVLSIALIVVTETVSERSQRREQVYQDMAQTTAGSQILAGPLLVLPYELQALSTVVDEKGVRTTKQNVTRHQQFILPRQLTMNGRLQVERRYRSLYEILLYGTQLKLEGRFEFSEPKDIQAPPGSTLRWLQPYLVVLVKDSRGLTTIPVLTWNGKNYAVKPGHHGVSLGVEGGFHSDLPSEVQAGGSFTFAVDLFLRGMQSLSWVPVGEETKVVLQAGWPHPSFQGRALPKSHQITEEGFGAEWESTHFSTNISQLITGQTAATGLQNQEIGVRLVQPVDIYQQTERSVKYGFLFIVLTFAAFLVFETIKQLSIHPVQYGLVGFALVLFYVLLLALSEHIAFAWAYLVASVASVSLLGFYIRYVVHSWKHSLGFALALALLDAIIYGILISEDYALLYGSCLLFVLLATAMIVTRRVNWNDMKFGR